MYVTERQQPNLSIHREACEHEVDVPTLGADIAHAIHIQLYVRRLWGMKWGGERRWGASHRGSFSSGIQRD
jgi:hypothetical protein